MLALQYHFIATWFLLWLHKYLENILNNPPLQMGLPKKHPKSIECNDHTGVHRHSSHSPSTNDVPVSNSFQFHWGAPYSYLRIQPCSGNHHCDAPHLWRNCSSWRVGSWKVSRNHEIIQGTKKPQGNSRCKVMRLQALRNTDFFGISKTW